MLFQAAAIITAAGVVAASRCKPGTTSSSSTIGWETVYTATGTAAVAAAAATARTSSPTSKVKGKVFDRYVSIWFENTDYAKAIADRECLRFCLCRVVLENFPRGC